MKAKLITLALAVITTVVAFNSRAKEVRGRSHHDRDVVLLSLDAASPLTYVVPVTDTINSQYLGLPVIVFDLRAPDDSVQVRAIKVAITSPTGGSGGTVAAAYLYQGSALVDSAAVVNGQAIFGNIPNKTSGTVIKADMTMPYTVKVDVVGVTSGSGFTITSSVASDGVKVVSREHESRRGIPVNGQAYGNTITVVGEGPLFTILGSPSISKIASVADQNGNITFLYAATFNISITAVGENVAMGLANSTFPAFAPDPAFMSVRRNGIGYSPDGYGVVAIYSAPINTVVSGDSSSFTVSENQTVVIPVTYFFSILNSGANVYGVEIDGVEWSTGSTIETTTVSGWLTPSI